MKKGMTIKQIAEAAGVSIGTVSRIINHQNFGYSYKHFHFTASYLHFEIFMIVLS